MTTKKSTPAKTIDGPDAVTVDVPPTEATGAPESPETATDTSESPAGQEDTSRALPVDTDGDSGHSTGEKAATQVVQRSKDPAFCTVCGDPLVRVEQPQAEGWNAYTGEKNPDTVRVTLECPSGTLFHNRLLLQPNGKWEQVV